MWKGYIVLAAVVVTALAATDKLVCYHGTWANYRPGDCRYTIENIDPTLCTHVVYAFVGLDGCKVRLLDSWLDVDLRALERTTGLRSQNPNLKALLAIGGWNEGSSKYSSMVGQASCRKTFIDSVIAVLETYKFDGFDLDWEYPNQRGGVPADVNNFAILVNEFKAAFNNTAKKYLLTAAVAACSPSVDTSYDVPAISKDLDLIHVMTYDMHGAWDPVTGHNAPLYRSANASTDFNLNDCINTWVQKGGDKDKLIIGLPIYGRTFTLANANENWVGARAYNGGTAGPCTREAGILGYNEICQQLRQGGWTEKWDDEAYVPYAYKGNQWVTFDNPLSITLKTEFVKSLGLGGIMVWSVETDDFNAACGERNIILKTIGRTLDLPVVEPPAPPVTTPKDENSTGNTGSPSPPGPTEPSTSAPLPPATGICSVPGFVRDPYNCGVFYQCVVNGVSYIEYRFDCPTGLYFDPSITAYKIVCYHGTWANYRQGQCRYTIENIDPNLCTHIIYAFAGLGDDCKIRLLDTWLDIDLGALSRFTGLRSKNSNLKALLAIGGWNEGSIKYSNMVSQPSCRSTFIDSVISILGTYDFDGFDLDWEYPSQRGGATTDKENFSSLLAEMKKAFQGRYLLTAAVAACTPSIDISYNVPKLSEYLDLIHIMTYDMHGSWDPVTGHNAPLYRSITDFSVNDCINSWIDRGANRTKIVVGAPIYGRTFTLANANVHGVGAPIVSGGTSGSCTQESGILGYNEVCQQLSQDGWTKVWDSVSQVPYAYKGNQWISYDNATSIALKTEFAKSERLGGVMVWSVETDDFNGACGEKNIILKTIRRTLELQSPPSEPDSSENSTNEGSSTTTTLPPATSICSNPGYVRDPKDCSVYYQCVIEGGNYITYRFTCPNNLYFDPSTAACNWPNLVNCEILT
ncbi:hypothetical protein Trydic_g4271 [Trypoxylus dichotomus]